MNIEIAGMWTKIRERGFAIYFLAVASLMMIFLIFVDLIFDLFFYKDPFNFENFLWWDIPINLILSILVAVYSWYFGGKRLQLKSDVIVMNLNEENGEKEK
ncbi:MAG: hypothetical protein M3367_12480 [Acidobacteriota bacterium]|nr:hypothetical protein [Acidobacteriota bacterium]